MIRRWAACWLVLAVGCLSGCESTMKLMDKAASHVQSAKDAKLKGSADVRLRPFRVDFGQSFGVNTGIEADIRASFDPNDVTERELYELALAAMMRIPLAQPEPMP